MTTFWLIGYDITEPKRLNRIHRRMVQYATPIEYSIFLFQGSERELQQCLKDLTRLMQAETDDVRCYPLPLRGYQTRIGKAAMPEGIQWTGLPAGLYAFAGNLATEPISRNYSYTAHQLMIQDNDSDDDDEYDEND